MIFLVEDDAVLNASVREFLEHSGHEVEAFLSAEDALQKAKASPPDLAICDLNLPGMSGLELLEELGRIDEGMVRMAVTAHASTRSAVRAMRAGCYEYLEKPVDLQKLNRLVERALGTQRDQRELSHLRQSQREATGLDSLLGESEALFEMRSQIASFAQLDAAAPPVLFLGETGVGKGLAARALHEQRFGAEAPWISVNCAALPNTLVEAELFGYERSAFTDAKQAKAGLFEAASGGTIFLDEIGEFSLEVQAKLLTMIEARTVRRLGSVRERPLHCAIVAASNVDLKEASQQGRFRSDLYHRLAGLAVMVPPLRERGEDLIILAESFVQEFSVRYGKSLVGLGARAESQLRGYEWPGNIRELRGAIERAAILSKPEQKFVAEHLLPRAAEFGAETSDEPNAALRVVSGDVHVDLPDDGLPFEELERAILKEALKRADGNVSGAARLLHLNRDQMRYRIRKLDLDES